MVLRILIGVFFGFATVLFAVNAALQWFYPVVPERYVEQMWMPISAEARPARLVTPGTFKITVPFEELKDRVGSEDKPIISYHFPSVDNGFRVVMEYWVPRGDSVFYYSKVDVSSPRLTFLEMFVAEWGAMIIPTPSDQALSIVFEKMSVQDNVKGIVFSLAALFVSALLAVVCFPGLLRLVIRGKKSRSY